MTWTTCGLPYIAIWMVFHAARSATNSLSTDDTSSDRSVGTHTPAGSTPTEARDTNTGQQEMLIVFTVGASVVAIILVCCLAVFVACNYRRGKGSADGNRARWDRQRNAQLINPDRNWEQEDVVIENAVCEQEVNVSDVVFEAAHENVQACGPNMAVGRMHNGSDENAEEGDYEDIDGEKERALDQTCSKDVGGASAAVVGTADKESDNPTAAPEPCLASESSQEDTYVPLSDILARKRHTKPENMALKERGASMAAGDSESAVYNHLNFNTPRRPIRTEVTSRPSCLYTQLCDIKIPSQGKTDTQ